MAKKRGKVRRKAAKKKVQKKEIINITKDSFKLLKPPVHPIHKIKQALPLGVLFIASFIVSLIAIMYEDWIVFTITFAIMLLSLILFKKGLEIEANIKKHISLFYLITWLSSLILGMLSIFRKKLISLCIAVFVMFCCSFLATLSKRKSKREELNLKKDIKELRLKEKKYETDLDVLLALLEKYKKLKVTDISEGFETSRETIEEWADILEKHGLLKINFPAFSGMELQIKEEKK